MSTEARILADIESIKTNDLDTQDLYREVCTILFFRYRRTPDAPTGSARRAARQGGANHLR
jgi:hypothetical protein